MNDNDAPAFPLRGFTNGVGEENWESRQHGMSLRDWFAGQALAGMLASEESSGTWEDFARSAYRLADAMLKERKR